MESLKNQGSTFEKTDIAASVEQLLSIKPNEAEAIMDEIENLRELISPYDGQDIDAETHAYIEEVAGKMHLLELKLTVIDRLRNHPAYK